MTIGQPRREVPGYPYGDLETEIRAAQAANREAAENSADSLAKKALGGLSVRASSNAEPVWQSFEDLRTWADSEISRAANGWLKSNIASAVPKNLQEMAQHYPASVATLRYLFEAKQRLAQIDLQTADKRQIAEEMHLVLLPWRMMHERGIHGTLYKQWFVPEDTSDRRTTLRPITDPISYKVARRWRRSLSVEEYIEVRLDQDGDWGVMLALDPTQHISSLDYASADDLHSKKISREVGEQVDALGFLEWQSLMAQERPILPARTGLWLPANVMHDQKMPYGVSNNSNFILHTPVRGVSAADARYCFAIQPGIRP